MIPSEIATPRCPGTLKEGFQTYCPATLRNLFGGRKVSHVLPEWVQNYDWERASGASSNATGWIQTRLRLQKNQLVQQGNGPFLLRTTDAGQTDARFPADRPANEHACLVIASRVFGIEVLANALIFFPDGKPALLYRYLPEMEHFIRTEKLLSSATPAHKPSSESYYDLASVITRRAAAGTLAIDRFFRNVVFCWLMASHLGHRMHMGLVPTGRGDLRLAPLFGIGCDRLHQLGPELGMPGGLFNGDQSTHEFRENGHYTRNEFESFGLRLGMDAARMAAILDSFCEKREQVLFWISKAFLPGEAKAVWSFHFRERVARLR